MKVLGGPQFIALLQQAGAESGDGGFFWGYSPPMGEAVVSIVMDRNMVIHVPTG